MKFEYFFGLLTLSSLFCVGCHAMDTQKRTITLNVMQFNNLNLVNKLRELCSKYYFITDEDGDNFLIFHFSNSDNFQKACDIYSKTLKLRFESPKKIYKPINLYPNIDPNLTLAKNFNDAAGQPTDKNFSNYNSPTQPTLFEKNSKYIKLKGKNE